MDDIKRVFDTLSQDYDKQRRKLIPCFDDFYNVAVSAVELAPENPVVLDIGAGTGLLSAFLLTRFPHAKLTLLDISEMMLDVAKERFSNYSNVRYITANYAEQAIDGEYDVIMSALSIHHLSDQQKASLYKECFKALKPGGVFINADQVLGSSPYLDSLYKRKWKAYIEGSDLSKEEILAGYERMKFDKEATLDRQLSWLKEAGFSGTDCIYKYYNFAIMLGRKMT